MSNISKTDALILYYKAILNILKPRIKDYLSSNQDDIDAKEKAREFLSVTPEKLIILFSVTDRQTIVSKVNSSMEKYPIPNAEKIMINNLLNKMCDLYV